MMAESRSSSHDVPLMKGDRLDCQQHSRWTNMIVSTLFLSRERGRRWTREKPSAWTEPSKGLLSNGSRCKRSPEESRKATGTIDKPRARAVFVPELAMSTTMQRFHLSPHATLA